MNKLSIIRNGYKLNIIDKRIDNSTPIVIIGSAIYYEKLFSDSTYNDLSLIYIDHRGFALSDDVDATYELSDIVEDIEAMRQLLALQTMHLLGHSGHGFMAMAYAEKYPQYIEKLILSNLAPMNTQERQDNSIAYFEETATLARKKAFYKAWQVFQENISLNESNRFSMMNIAMQAHSFYDFNYNGAYLWDDVINNMPALDYLWGDVFAKFDTKAFIDGYQNEILLLLSEHDYLVAPTSLWKDIVFSNTNITYGQFSYSGHNPMLEEPIKFRKYLNLR